jgi:hypothetical protein
VSVFNPAATGAAPRASVGRRSAGGCETEGNPLCVRLRDPSCLCNARSSPSRSAGLRTDI